MQNAGIAALGLNWRYLACDVRVEELHEAIRGAQAMRFLGLNLTVPHKLHAVKLVDVLDDSARQWGAVNTIRFEGRLGERWLPLGELGEAEPEAVRARGFNTDADAIVRSLREDLSFDARGRRVMLLGTGGAGRAAALRLALEGVKELYLVNRTESKAAQLGAEIQSRFPTANCRAGYPTGQVDLVLNATSAGLKPTDSLPFDGDKFEIAQAACAYDMIYRPATTPFLQLAQEAGLKTANGLGMLLYQGTEALELWTGQPAPVAVMRAALEKDIYGD
jgi:shikimate dehydrogenase